MSTATLEVEGKSSLLFFSVSAIEKFMTCENQWLLRQTTPPDERRFATSEAMELGTLIHRLKNAWWSGRSWKVEWLAALIEEVGVDVGYYIEDGLILPKSGWQAPRAFVRALPIMEAWDEVHSEHPSTDPDPSGKTPSGEVISLAGAESIAQELPFDLPLPGVPGARIRGFLDGMLSMPVDGIRTHNVQRVREEKTMGRWGRENQVGWDLQLHTYGWAARQLFGVTGAVFEATSTYDYKSGGPEKRFKRIVIDFDDRAIARTVEDLQRVARRAKALLKNPKLAVRNVGDKCTYCDFRTQCLTPWLVEA